MRPETEKISLLVILFFFITQLIGSAPSVSNFASYSGGLIVIIRLAAALTLEAGAAGAEFVCELGVVAVAAGVVVELADGEGVAAGLGFGGETG